MQSPARQHRTVWALCLLIAPLASAAMLHVAPAGDDEAGDGSADRPFRTIQHAVDRAGPGDTVHVQEGIYREAIVFPRSGEPEARIAVRAAPGAAVVLDGATPIRGWTRCAPDEPGLTVQGIRHPRATAIHRARVPRSLLGGAVTDQILFEGETQARVARWPEQPRGVGLDTGRMRPVPEAAFQRDDRLPDPARFDDGGDGNPWPEMTRSLDAGALEAYWRGTTITFWLRRDGNYTQTRTVAGREGDTLALDSALRRALQSGDRYALAGHPHALTSPGEFYVDRAADADGMVTVYYWPIDESALETAIAAPALSHGFFAIHQGHISIEGFHIRRFRGRGIWFRHVAGTDGTNPGIRVRNTVVEDVGDDGIYLQACDDGLVRGCRVERVGGRGIFLNGGARGVIAENTVRASSGTCISFYGMRQSRIVDNRIYGAVGVHANGSSCYMGCRDILVARNIYYHGAGATFQNIVNLTVFANVWDGLGRGQNLLAMWPDSRNHSQASGGELLTLHNTILHAARDNAALFRGFGTSRVHNNLIGGSGHTGAIDHRSHNGWMGRFQLQRDRNRWTPGEGSWQFPEGPLGGSATPAQVARVFRDARNDDPEARDVRLADGPETNPAIHAGREVRSILREAGVLEAFPDFDFSVDLDGRPWAPTPSMGAYEVAP